MDVADNYFSTFVIFQEMDSKLKKLRGILQTIMLASLLFFNFFGFLNKEVNIADIRALKQRMKIYQRLYAIFSAIMGCYFH